LATSTLQAKETCKPWNVNAPLERYHEVEKRLGLTLTKPQFDYLWKQIHNTPWTLRFGGFVQGYVIVRWDVLTSPYPSSRSAGRDILRLMGVIDFCED
ncbi:hypothetical protein THIOM_005179, partial [Candidatus Thiomargarita nelsonii]